MSWIVRFLNGQIEQFHTMHFYNVTLLCVFLQIIINTKQWCSFKCIIYKKYNNMKYLQQYCTTDTDSHESQLSRYITPFNEDLMMVHLITYVPDDH
jgi:hypothetical protein